MTTTFARAADTSRDRVPATDRVIAVRPCAVRGGDACRVGAPFTGHRERPAGRSRLRLTRRGRIVLVWLPLGALVTALLCTAAAPGALAGGAPASVVVRTGDSLWSIALRVAPDRDPRDEIADIARLNRLHDTTLIAGQRLRLP